jgi:E3 ubiquitin-protein ligase makorin
MEPNMAEVALALADEDELVCAICLESPTVAGGTWGLLEKCSHPFCTACIEKWRSLDGKSQAQIISGALSACPLCRTPATFVCRSTYVLRSHREQPKLTRCSIFYPDGPDKAYQIATFKHKASAIDCKHYQPLARQYRCPFGSDCVRACMCCVRSSL